MKIQRPDQEMIDEVIDAAADYEGPAEHKLRHVLLCFTAMMRSGAVDLTADNMEWSEQWILAEAARIERERSQGHLHPDGCYTADTKQFRDCSSDGHFMCVLCTRREVPK